MLLEVPHIAILTTAMWACWSGLMLLLLLLFPSRKLWPPTPFQLICHLFCDDKTLVSLTLFLLNSRMFNMVFFIISYFNSYAFKLNLTFNSLTLCPFQKSLRTEVSV
jgi:hypothetical protein